MESYYTTSTTMFAFLVLHAFTSHLLSAADIVTDRDGDAIRNGGTYHILPLFGVVKGGGIELAKTGNETCPLTVVQSRTTQTLGGFPTKISSPYRIAYISEGLILNLAFASSPVSCVPTPPTWTVVKNLPEGQAVKLPGYPNTVSGWFKIEKSELEYLYKVVFCARNSINNACGDVGVSVDDEGNRRLVVTDDEDEGIIVEFMKTSSVHT